MSVVSVKTGLVALLVRVAFAEVQQSALAGTAAALDAGMVEADHVRAQARASQRAAPVAGVPRGGGLAALSCGAVLAIECALGRSFVGFL